MDVSLIYLGVFVLFFGRVGADINNLFIIILFCSGHAFVFLCHGRMPCQPGLKGIINYTRFLSSHNGRRKLPYLPKHKTFAKVKVCIVCIGVIIYL